MSTKIEVSRHKGRLIEHSLYELSDSRKLPDEESALIFAAADYIHWLEAQLRFSDEAVLMNLFEFEGKTVRITKETVDHYVDWPELNGNRGFESGKLCEGAEVKILKVEISPWGNPEIIGVTAIEFNGKVYEYTKEMYSAFWCFWTNDDNEFEVA